MLKNDLTVSITESEVNVLIDIQLLPLAFPTPLQYSWTKDNILLSNNERVYYSYGAVLFNTLRRIDSGIYSHTVTTTSPNGDIASTVATFTLNILCKLLIRM